MESALIVSNTEKGVSFLSEILAEADFPSIYSCKTAGAARRRLIDSEYDLCIVNSPLPDEPGELLAKNIITGGTSEVILIVRSEYFEEVAHSVEDYGIVTIAKPINRTLFWGALKLTQAAHRRISRMRSENEKLLQKIEDMRTIDRAKLLLVSYLRMTEPEAHKYIEKQAMDMRMTRRAVAEGILKTYEN
jgi:response regulator NasT